MTDIRRLDLNLVVVLDALLEHRSQVRAAEALGMGQPAVSAALARLRELLGDPLLERSGRGSGLTPRAEALLPAVTESLAEAQRVFDALPEFDPATSTRTFLLTASDYVLSELTSPLITLLAREAPGTRVEFDPLPAAASVSPVDLLQRDVTIAGTGRGVPGKRASLFSDRFVCVVDRASPALVDGALSVEALRTTPCVRTVLGAHAATPVDDMLAAADIVPRVAATVQGLLPVPFAVAGTGWVGWVPERTALRYAAALGLVIARTPVVPGVLVEAAHWHPSKTADPALQWLLGRLRRASEVVEFGDEEP